MIVWNPWHGCHKYSEGCANCYMYFLDGKRGVDTSVVTRTKGFGLPLSRRRDGTFKVASGEEVQVGLSTDFFVAEADQWRGAAWRIIRQRPDVLFRLLTKRVARVRQCLPEDWGEGYENVMLSVSCENQRCADSRLPLLVDIPARHKGVMAAPLIGPIEMECFLSTGQIDEVFCDGERYEGARPCHYEWVRSLSEQSRKHNVPFSFFATGTVFVKDNKTYHIPDKRLQCAQAAMSGLSHGGRPLAFHLRGVEDALF